MDRPPTDEELRAQVDRESARLIAAGGDELLRIAGDTILASFRDWILADRQVEIVRARIREWIEGRQPHERARGRSAGE